jgi:hypothetical protein
MPSALLAADEEPKANEEESGKAHGAVSAATDLP